MKRFWLLPLFIFAPLAFGKVANFQPVAAIPDPYNNASDPEVVESVDLQRYSGVWHEIAHQKNFFQRGCVRSMAEYAVLSDTEISVKNTCTKENGKTRDIDGVATVTDTQVPAKLKVKFDFFRRGDYWIIDLDSNYQWAVVSAPKKKSLFILSRTAPMDSYFQQQLIQKLKDKGFKTDDLVFDQY